METTGVYYEQFAWYFFSKGKTNKHHSAQLNNQLKVL